MGQLLYKTINPPIRLLLKSPFHSIMSHNTLVIEFTGRRSGKIMSTPVSYVSSEGMVHCFTGRSRIWWRNLEPRTSVRLLIKGQWIDATPKVVKDELTIMPALDKFLRAVPRDASHSNVRMNKDGSPNTEDIQSAANNLVLMTFTPV